MSDLDLTTANRFGASSGEPVTVTPESAIAIDAPPPTSAPCRLRRDDDVVIDEPNAAELAIEAEQLVERDCSFVVLERDSGRFVQAAPDQIGMLWLEYRDGLEQPLYRAASPIQVEQLAEILCAYARGDGGWIADVMWVEETIPNASESSEPSRRPARQLAWFAAPLALLVLGASQLGDPFGVALCGFGAFAAVLTLSSGRRRR